MRDHTRSEDQASQSIDFDGRKGCSWRAAMAANNAFLIGGEFTSLSEPGLLCRSAWTIFTLIYDRIEIVSLQDV